MAGRQSGRDGGGVTEGLSERGWPKGRGGARARAKGIRDGDEGLGKSEWKSDLVRKMDEGKERRCKEWSKREKGQEAGSEMSSP